jgi:hypothetical protein
MHTELGAIVHSEYGASEKVLKITKRQLKTGELGSEDVLVKVIARPIHHGDIHILSARPQGGPVAPIPADVGNLSTSQLVTALAPGARVVKAFNHMTVPNLEGTRSSMARDELHLFRQTMTRRRSELTSSSKSLPTPSLILEIFAMEV